jgi:hypothetical protein
MDTAILPALPPEALRWRCDATTLDFTTTDQIAPHQMIGQDRGLGAIEFGPSLETPRASARRAERREARRLRRSSDE